MSISQIEITSNSSFNSIKNDFESLESSLKLLMLLEIKVDQEDIILQTIAEQLQTFIHLQELHIIVSRQSILEHFHILTEGLAQLINLKLFSISFQEQCFAGEINFMHLHTMLQSLIQLTDLGVCVERNNALNQRALQQLNESFSYLRGLLKLKIQISEGNQFDDQMAEDLAQGFTKISQLQELELQFDCTYITQKGMIAIGNSLQGLNKTLYKLKIVFEGYCKYLGRSIIFQLLPQLSQLKILEIKSKREINMNEQEAKIIVESLSKLINLEAFSLQQIFAKSNFYQYLQLIIQFSHFKELKQLDLELIDFHKIPLETVEALQVAFSSLQTLEKLKLLIKDSTRKENYFINILASSFEKWNQLTSLELKIDCYVNKIDSVNLMKSFEHIKSVESLQLTLGLDFYIDQEVLDHLAQSLQNSIQLRQLHLLLHTISSNMKIKQDKPKLNLINLKNLEELILKNYQNFIVNKDEVILSQLKSLDKLRILSLDFCNMDKEAARSFSSAFVNLKSLTDLSLSFSFKKNSPQYIEWLQFDSFSSLNSLKNLNLLFDFILQEKEAKSLLKSLLGLTNITSFQLESGFQTLNCLHNILNGFSNSKLKNLKLVIKDMYDIPRSNEDLKLFSSVQFLENMCVEGIDIYGDDYNTQILINSFKELIYVKKIVIQLVKPGGFGQNIYNSQNIWSQTTLSKNFNMLISYIQFFPNLLEFEIRDSIERQIPRLGLELIQEQNRTLNLRDIDFNIFFKELLNNKLYSLMKQLKNLRQLRLALNINQLSECKNLPKKPLLNEIPRFLTKLDFAFITRLQNLSIYDNLGEEFRVIKHLKYLTELSFYIDAQNFNMSDFIYFGQSLQQIDQIRNLTLNFIHAEQYPSQALVELSKGISSQKLLQLLSIEIENIKEISFSENMVQVIESLKQLQYLTNLKLNLKSFRGTKNQVILCDEILQRLGKSLSFIQNIRKLDIKLQSHNLQNIDEGMSQFANALESNSSLISLDLSLFGVSISGKAVQALGNGLTYLNELQFCSFNFYRSKIDDCSGILQGIQQSENLTSFLLSGCHVKRLSFSPLSQILKQKEGRLVSHFSKTNYMKNTFSIQYKSSTQDIEIEQTCEELLPLNEHLELVKFMANLSPNIVIEMSMSNDNIFSDCKDSKLIFRQLVTLSISKLSITINSKNINFYEQRFIKLNQVKELDITFDEVNNRKIITILRNLSMTMGQILKLKVILSKNKMNDQSFIKKFITAIKQQKSINTLRLQIHCFKRKSEAYLYGKIQSELTSLIILSVNNFTIENYLLYLQQDILEMKDEEENEDDFYDISDILGNSQEEDYLE